MHRVTRGWNMPLALALFGGAVFVGGAMLAYAETHHAPTRTDVGNPEARPFPSWPDEMPAAASSVAHAPTVTPRVDAPKASTKSAPPAIGGGPRATAEDDGAPRDTTGDTTRGARSNVTSAPPAAKSAPTTTTTTMPSMPSVPITTTIASASPTPSASASASAAPLAAAGQLLTDAGAPENVPVYPGGVPIFGAPPSAAASGVPAVGNGVGNNSPIYMGSSGGTTNPGVVDAKPSITAPVLVPMSAASNPEGFWPTISPFLRSGDLVVASAGGTPDAFLAWSDRVRTDTPLVGYVVAFDRAADVESALSKLPGTLDTIGLTTTAGMDDKTFTALAAKVHGAGRKLFVSTSVPSSVSPATIGARSDIIEIVGSDAPDGAKATATALRATGHPAVFVRMSVATAGRALDTANASNDLLKAVPDAGISLPFTPNVGRVLSDLRATP